MLEKVVRPERFELPTFWFVARRSIQVSYERICFTRILSRCLVHCGTARNQPGFRRPADSFQLSYAHRVANEILPCQTLLG